MATAEAVKAARAKALDKARVVQRVLNTEDGRQLLAILRREFLSSTKGRDEHETIFKAGQADVVAYLMALQDVREDG